MKRTGESWINGAAPAKKAKTAPASKRTQPKPLDVQPWEVEGTDYIFAAPELGAGYFVLRCNHGLATVPMRFMVHPFETNDALTHFNDKKGLTCHDTSRQYSKEDILAGFTHRGETKW